MLNLKNMSLRRTICEQLGDDATPPNWRNHRGGVFTKTFLLHIFAQVSDEVFSKTMLEVNDKMTDWGHSIGEPAYRELYKYEFGSRES